MDMPLVHNDSYRRKIYTSKHQNDVTDADTNSYVAQNYSRQTPKMQTQIRF